MHTRLNLPPAALLVEDDHMMALLCARALEPLGLQVLCCNSSLNAVNVAHLHDHRIQLILVDVVLATPELRLSHNPIHPESDGARLLSLLKRFCRHAVAVQMSAYSRQELAAHGYEIEADNFLHKPFTPATLRRLVKTLLPDLKVPNEPIFPASEITWCD